MQPVFFYTWFGLHVYCTMYEQLLKWSSCRRLIRKFSWIQCWCFNVTCSNKMWDSHVMFLHYISVRRVTVSWRLHTYRLLNVFIFSAATFKPLIVSVTCFMYTTIYLTISLANWFSWYSQLFYFSQAKEMNCNSFLDTSDGYILFPNYL